MKSFRMLSIQIALISLGSAALLLSPSCKAQETSPDHFTNTGVQDVYENAPAKTVAPKLKQRPLQGRAQQTSSRATLQAAAERIPSLSAQAGAQAVADKRKPAPKAPKKQ